MCKFYYTTFHSCHPQPSEATNSSRLPCKLYRRVYYCEKHLDTYSKKHSRRTSRVTSVLTELEVEEPDGHIDLDRWNKDIHIRTKTSGRKGPFMGMGCNTPGLIDTEYRALDCPYHGAGGLEEIILKEIENHEAKKLRQTWFSRKVAKIVAGILGMKQNNEKQEAHEAEELKKAERARKAADKQKKSDERKAHDSQGCVVQ